MAVLYEDARIVCDDDAITIHTYYFPWGSRRIPYITIRTFEERSMGLLTGQLRIWGTGDFKHWYHYDPKRPSKTRALVIDTGQLVKAVITPDDVDRVAAILKEKTE